MVDLYVFKGSWNPPFQHQLVFTTVLKNAIKVGVVGYEVEVNNTAAAADSDCFILLSSS